jgi:peptidoglycan/LPS O-acetylase OafA/YrhL
VAADTVRGMAAGKYSYCLYLIHLPVMRAVREYVFNPEEYETLAVAPWIGQVLFYPVAAAPAFALAWLSWRYFESPILSLKKHFEVRKLADMPPAP